MARPIATAMLILPVVAALAACVDLGNAAPDAAPIPDSSELDGDAGRLVEVVMFALAFDPPRLTIRAGTTVRWTNLDAVPHTVTEGSPEATGQPVWDSELLSTGMKFARTFNERGRWIYYCRTHANIMRDALVEVQ